MKKLKNISIIILIITTILMIVFNIYEFIFTDSKPPVLTCPEEILEVSVKAGEEELLKDVKAQDKRSGDVSDSIVIENIAAMLDDGTRTITYAAMDEAGNVGRTKRIMRYTDYELPRFDLTDSLRFSINNLPGNWIENVQASSVLDGDLIDNIKYQMVDEIFSTQEGFQNVEIWVQDSAGNKALLTTTFEFYDDKKEIIQVDLQQYLIYLHVNDAFDPQIYFKESSIEGDLSIESSVDISIPGTYYVDYIVQKDDAFGKNRLIVVVEE